MTFRTPLCILLLPAKTQAWSRLSLVRLLAPVRHLLHLLAPLLPPCVSFTRGLPNLLFPSVVRPLPVAGTALFHLALIIAPSLAVVGVPLAP